jgi:putative transcriptional regulator
LHDGGPRWDSTLAITDKLFLTTSRDILEDMARGAGPDNAIVALGCAGWGTGQLEHELTENDWLTAPADAQLLFSEPLESRWQAAAGRIGVDFAHLADYAGHA